jgi:cellulose synthase/poly-beta-1,6-N-acetylglucosamine synthase-like glycosyltransferase
MILISSSIVILAASLACLPKPMLILARFRKRAAEQAGASPTADATSTQPRALVILPVKGIASELPELPANLIPVLEQDYPDFRVIFAVGDSQDPA